MNKKRFVAFVMILLSVILLAACNKKELSDIEVVEPAKKTYLLGESIDMKDLDVYALFSDGTRDLLAKDQYVVSGFDSSTTGIKVINIVYKGITKTFEVTIIGGQANDQIAYITISGSYKVDYEIGETFNDDGIIVTVTYKDASTKVLKETEYSISGFNTDTVGSRTLTVSYEGFHTTFTILVSNQPEVGVSKQQAYQKLDTYKDISKFSNEYKAYYETIKDQYKTLIAEQLTTNTVRLMLSTALVKLDDVYSALNGGLIADWIRETKNPIQATWPVFENIPTDKDLFVQRGFSGSVIDYFEIKAKDSKGNDITSLIRYQGEPVLSLSGVYEIYFEVSDLYGNTSVTDKYLLNVEKINILPVVTVLEKEIILNNRTIDGFDILQGVVATDGTGLDLTNQIEVEVYNGLDQKVTYNKQPGYYKFIYKVSDSDGNENQNTREVTVMPNSSSILDNNISEGNFVTPYLAYFNSTTIIDWVPSADDKYVNIGTIPLQNRVKGQGINPNANSDVRVAILDQITEQMNGVQFYQGFDEYMIEYYQYMDIAVSWNGSGNITAPTREVINAFHKNGVKILGNIFMKPQVYGGTLATQQALLRKDEQGNYIVGDKLIEIAQYFGFDGWFINLETEGGDAEMAQGFLELCLYMQNKVRELGYDIEIMWYDSMINTGSISWQGTLNERNQMFFQHEDQVVNNSMFLDFRWDGRYGTTRNTIIKEAAEKAIALGRNPYDLYTGFDTQQYGYVRGSGGYNWAWNKFFDATTLQPYTSIGIYMSSWTFSQDGKKTNNNNPATYDAFTKNANYMWVGPDGDPRYSQVDLTKPAAWYGISSFVLEKTAIIGDSFHTNFSTGNGHQFYKDGQVVTNFKNGYNNLDTQDLLPTWRWIKDNVSESPEDAPLNIGFDFNDAYNGGSSLLIQGDLTPNNASQYQVYKTYLNVYDDTKLNLVFKSSHAEAVFNVRLTFEDNQGWYNDAILLPIDQSDVINEWRSVSLNLSAYTGKKITSIGYQIATTEMLNDFKLRLGQMTLYRTSMNISSNDVQVIGNITIDDIGMQYSRYADIRISWDPVVLGEHQYPLYEVYYESEDGKMIYLRSSYSNHIYVKDIDRVVNGQFVDQSSIHIFAYDNIGQKVAQSSTSFMWNEPTVGGRIKFTMSASLAPSGTVVRYTPEKSPITDTLEWIFEGVEESDITYLSNGQVDVKYRYQGMFGVTVIAKNQFGESRLEVPNAILISDAASKVTNITRNGRIHSYSGYVVANEHPRYLIDGSLGTKWCETTATSPNEKWVIVDLNDIYTISSFDVHHAGQLEQAGYNTIEFEIQVTTQNPSSNPEWQTVVRVTNNTSNVTKHAISPVEARYVRLVVIKGGSDNAARIYELIIYGRV